MKIALAYNLKPTSVPAWDDTYAEWDDLETIEAVRDALAADHEVVLVEADARVESRIVQAAPDLIFNMAEGWHGAWREAQLPALLEHLKIPFTGSSARTLALGLDKAATKRVLRQHGLPTPDGVVMHQPDQACDLSSFPLMVKPLYEGSSKGIWGESVVSNPVDLRRQVRRVLERYEQPALVETFLPGREFTVALLGNGVHVEVLPVVEIRFSALHREAVPIYSYEAKWLWDTPARPLDIFHCPAEIDAALAEQLAALCRRAFRALECRDWCRIDVRLDACGAPAILEMNPLPGILPHADSHSCFPQAAAQAGMTYTDLIRRVVALACERYESSG
ncbi:D-alanine--D-alanine ligase family protein [Candidatus Entotheonella palauensis]|uniref:D-alanine--D-alanine ligase family protein n=1 Tax=Candidatus Entotheonella palauensis TaxID=93172 RepID=UPI000B7D4673|nr:ATP-grasp domain-containing protein [Candidatus Entotheonella palauensis]